MSKTKRQSLSHCLSIQKIERAMDRMANELGGDAAGAFNAYQSAVEYYWECFEFLYKSMSHLHNNLMRLSDKKRSLCSQEWCAQWDSEHPKKSRKARVERLGFGVAKTKKKANAEIKKLTATRTQRTKK